MAVAFRSRSLCRPAQARSSTVLLHNQSKNCFRDWNTRRRRIDLGRTSDPPPCCSIHLRNSNTPSRHLRRIALDDTPSRTFGEDRKTGPQGRFGRLCRHRPVLQGSLRRRNGFPNRRRIHLVAFLGKNSSSRLSRRFAKTQPARSHTANDSFAGSTPSG